MNKYPKIKNIRKYQSGNPIKTFQGLDWEALSDPDGDYDINDKLASYGMESDGKGGVRYIDNDGGKYNKFRNSQDAYTLLAALTNAEKRKAELLKKAEKRVDEWGKDSYYIPVSLQKEMNEDPILKWARGAGGLKNVKPIEQYYKEYGDENIKKLLYEFETDYLPLGSSFSSRVKYENILNEEGFSPDPRTGALTRPLGDWNSETSMYNLQAHPLYGQKFNVDKDYSNIPEEFNAEIALKKMLDKSHMERYGTNYDETIRKFIQDKINKTTKEESTNPFKNNSVFNNNVDESNDVIIPKTINDNPKIINTTKDNILNSDKNLKINLNVRPQNSQVLPKEGSPQWIQMMKNKESLNTGNWDQSEMSYRDGGIHIKPENRGKFTAAAQSRGMGVQEFANQVLANKDNYSSTLRKQANFAKNAAGWKYQYGGKLPVFQGSGTIPAIPAIQFTEGFETNRGYPNKGYTSTTDNRDMSKDYEYLLQDIPEPLQVVLLDAAHNQSNIAGTMLLALAESSPNAYQSLINKGAIPGLSLDKTPMQNAMLLNNNEKAYSASEDYKKNVGNILRGYLVGAYESNPVKTIDDITKSRLQRYSSFSNRNEDASSGGSKMGEWAERSLAAGQYAKDLINNTAKSPEYYFDITQNKGDFRYDSDPIREKSLGAFPGDSSPDVQKWYDDIGSLYNNIITPKPSKLKTNEPINQNNNQLNLGEVYTPTPSNSVELFDYNPNITKKSTLGNMLNKQLQDSSTTGVGTSDEPIYYDGNKHYKFLQNSDGSFSKVTLNDDGKFSATSEVKKYSNVDEMKKDAENMFKLDVRTSNQNESNNIINNNIQAPQQKTPSLIQNIGKFVDKISTDNNPYKDYYSDEEQSIKQQRQNLKDYVLKNKAQQREINLQRKDANINTRLNQAANRNLFLEAKEKAIEPIVDRKAMNRTLRDIENTEKRIAKMQELNQKRLNKIPQPQFQIGGMLPQFQWGQTIGKYKTNNPDMSYGSVFDTNALLDPNSSYDWNFKGNYNSSKPSDFSSATALPSGPSNINWGNNNSISSQGSYSKDSQGVYRDPFGNIMNKGSINKKNNQSNQPSKPNPFASYDPTKLTMYGNKMQAAGVDLPTAFNFARFVTDEGYQHPLIMPDFKMKQQYAQANIQPIVKNYYAGMQQLRNNLRDTSALVGNITNLYGEETDKKINEIVRAQQQQKQYDKTFQQEQQDYATMKAKALQATEDKKVGDITERENYLAETVSGAGKALIEKSKLYNSEAKMVNEINAYVNQLSPDYKIAMDKNGMKYVTFKGRPVPEGHQIPVEVQNILGLAFGKQPEYLASNTTNTSGTTVQNSRMGGKLKDKTFTVTQPENKKRLRTSLY